MSTQVIQSVGRGPRDFKTLMRSSYFLSSTIHAAVVGAYFVLQFWSPQPPEVVNVPIEVFEQPKPALNPIRVEAKAPEPKVKKIVEARKVFGVTRSSVQSDTGLEVKAGNTVAKAQDDLKLRPEDEAPLPIPTEEYLVSEMPQLLTDMRIAYPEEARKKNIQGAVVFDLLIDASGVVREATLIEGPGFGLNEAANQVIRQFRFKPASVEGKSVAVRIRYAYRFVLER